MLSDSQSAACVFMNTKTFICLHYCVWNTLLYNNTTAQHYQASNCALCFAELFFSFLPQLV